MKKSKTKTKPQKNIKGKGKASAAAKKSTAAKKTKKAAPVGKQKLTKTARPKQVAARSLRPMADPDSPTPK